MKYIRNIYRDINENYMIRNNKRQKDSFKTYLKKQLKKSGIDLIDDTGKTTPRSFMFPALKCNYNNLESKNSSYDFVITAHYDTPKNMLLLPIINSIKKVNPLNKIIKNGSLMDFINALIFSSIILITMIFNALNINLPSIVEIFLYFVSAIELLMLIISALPINNSKNMNDNTSGILSILLLAHKIKKFNNSKLSNRVKFILFDNEEKGLVGSKGHNEKYEDIYKNKIVINLDCVGLGDSVIVSYINKADMKDDNINSIFSILENNFSEKGCNVLKAYKHGSSDYLTFKDSRAISISLNEKGLFNYIIPYMHTSKDRYIDLDNLEIVTDSLVQAIIDIEK